VPGVGAQEPIEIPERTESVACPLCEGTQGVVVGRRGRFGMLVRNLCCATCALIYVTPRPTPHAMARYYRGAYREHYKGVGRLRADQTRIAPGSDESKQAAASKFEAQALIVRRVANPAPGARVLEIGCQRGETLSHLVAELGIEAHGIEPSERDAECARAAGVACFAGPIEAYEPGARRFDLVQMFHVLEHLHEPLELLITIRSWLAPGGSLLIEVPNACFPYGLLEENFFQNVHLVSFSPETLGAMLLRAGYEVVQVVDTHMLLVLARRVEHDALPLPFERAAFGRPEHDARWMSARLASYATLERIRQAVRQRGMTPELLQSLLQTLAAPAFTGPRLECCAELVEWLMQNGQPSAARLLLEKLAQHEDDAELSADLRAMAERCGGGEARADI
jgi:2-polyprenyl-3-methyl-5-hydroxy-6-metoxy-1,4-benzoquinol methylase